MSRLKKSKELKVSKRFERTTRKRKAASQAYCLAWIPNFFKRETSLLPGSLGTPPASALSLPAPRLTGPADT
jgi:hypothetical protein